MKITEVTSAPDLKDVDLKDDLLFFMNNDPVFYRRIFFPTLSKLKSAIKSKKKCNHNIFRPCIDKAAETYCKKFDIAGGDKSVFTDVDRDSLARQIFGQERQHIVKGEYDGSEK
jgi:ABC-type uncharacterized transport system substrate-binding protein